MKYLIFFISPFMCVAFLYANEDSPRRLLKDFKAEAETRSVSGVVRWSCVITPDAHTFNEMEKLAKAPGSTPAEKLLNFEGSIAFDGNKFHYKKYYSGNEEPSVSVWCDGKDYYLSRRDSERIQVFSVLPKGTPYSVELLSKLRVYDQFLAHFDSPKLSEFKFETDKNRLKSVTFKIGSELHIFKMDDRIQSYELIRFTKSSDKSLSRSLLFSYNDAGEFFSSIDEKVAIDGGVVLEKDIEIKSFSPLPEQYKFLPSGFGFKIVDDYRFNGLTQYPAFDSLPGRVFAEKLSQSTDENISYSRAIEKFRFFEETSSATGP